MFASHPARRLWARWVVANTVGQIGGLGATFAIGYGVFGALAGAEGLTVAVVTAGLMVITGAIEGAVVGATQWWAMAFAFPGLARRTWMEATIIGAVIAWGLGTLPMVIGSAGSVSASGLVQPVDDGPSTWLVVALTALMGALAGLLLAVMQWRVLRRHARRAWRWLPANALAWAAGMPIVFEAVGRATMADSLAVGIATMAGALALAGAVVGAIHGVALAALAASPPAGSPRAESSRVDDVPG